MTDVVPVWECERRSWGWADAVALAVWSLAIVAFFWDVVSLKRALFYFDITEINYPYRDFFARELRAGRFSRWCPGLHCGLPLYSESQAGYLHPLKYLLYGWLATWQALNLDTVLSVWLTGVGGYGWLRRHVGPAGALTGAAVLGLSGFTWGHLVHTSWINALAAVPFVVWALETAWQGSPGRGIVLGSLALATQVFAGQMQCALLTSLAVLVYAVFRAATARGLGPAARALATALGLLALGGMLSAIQWIPSKELLDRSERAGGLSYEELTYGSWSPELLPSLVLREAYGTRARDTDWLDGFYQYHEMDAYVGVLALALAVVGGAAGRDRWVAFWVFLAVIGGTLMLGRYTILFDQAHQVPILGSSRIPMRHQLWVSLALAALAAVGVDRLTRPGVVRLRAAIGTLLAVFVASAAILLYNYTPIWTQPDRWTRAVHQAHYRWLAAQWVAASLRTALLAAAGCTVVFLAARSSSPTRRRRLASLLPLLVLADLLGAHVSDVPTVTPDYWTVPPPSARALLADPDFVRLVGVARRSAGEPGYASEPVEFHTVRDTLDWSLPIVWGLASAQGASPVVPRRTLEFVRHAGGGSRGLDLEAVTHLVSAHASLAGWGHGRPAGAAYLYRNTGALPRARLMGRPVYVETQQAAVAALDRLGTAVRDRLVVEDPTRPLSAESPSSGTATVTRDLPELVAVQTRSPGPAYLVLADAFDPGWSATLDGRPAEIRPAYVAFRAVFVPPGNHAVVFRYRPAGFALGRNASACGLVAALVLWFWKGRTDRVEPEHGADPRHLDRFLLGTAVAVVLIVLLSSFTIERGGRLAPHPRWQGSFHRFTWAAGIEAMQQKQERDRRRPPGQRLP